MHLEDEGMVQSQQDLSFKLDVAEVVFLAQNGLIKDLHCIVATSAIGLLLLNKEDLGEAALTKEANDSNRVQVHVVAEVCGCIGATSLHDVLVHAYALLSLLVKVALEGHRR